MIEGLLLRGHLPRRKSKKKVMRGPRDSQASIISAMSTSPAETERKALSVPSSQLVAALSRICLTANKQDRVLVI